MSNYEKELQAEIERVTLRGSPDKQTLAKLASIIWRMEQRIIALESEVVVDEKPPTFKAVEEEKPAPKVTADESAEDKPKSARRATKSK